MSGLLAKLYKNVASVYFLLFLKFRKSKTLFPARTASVVIDS